MFKERFRPMINAATALAIGYSSLVADSPRPTRSNQELTEQVEFQGGHAPIWDGTISSQSTPNTEVQTGDFETITGEDDDGRNVTIKRIFGDNDPDNRISYLIVPWEFLSFEQAKTQAQELVKYVFQVKPLDSYQNRFTFWIKSPARLEDWPCDKKEGSLWNCITAVTAQQVNDVILITKVTPQETIHLRAGNSGYGKGVYDFFEGQPYPPSPPSLFTASLITLPKNPNAWDMGLPAHELGHSQFNLADEYLYEKPPSRMGNTFWNCKEDPDWSRSTLADNPKTQYEGCANQPKGAYRPCENNIMRRFDVHDFCPLNSWWVKQIIAESPFRYQKPKLDIKLLKQNGFENLVDMTIPLGTKHVKIELIPAQNPNASVREPDGPPFNLVVSDPKVIQEMRKTGFLIPKPDITKGPYNLLPDMTYTFKVSVSNSKNEPAGNSTEWEEYSPWPLMIRANSAKNLEFRTPKRTADKIILKEPIQNTNPDPTLTLVWDNHDRDVFYYEIQVSRDPKFNDESKENSPPLYWNLVHGGKTQPVNSYTIPKESALEKGKTYYWRVRPRIQGDGTPVEWSKADTFKS